MYQGKHSAPLDVNLAGRRSGKSGRIKGAKKKLALLMALVLLLVGGIGGTLAYLLANTQEIENKFVPAGGGIEIIEEFNGQEKTNVKATNTGEYPVYLRATYVATLVSDADGSVVPQSPALNSSLGGDWTQDGTYWYYGAILQPGETSTNFINSISLVSPVEGCHLEVEVIFESVQAQPAEAVQQAWGVQVVNGVLSPATGA